MNKTNTVRSSIITIFSIALLLCILGTASTYAASKPGKVKNVKSAASEQFANLVYHQKDMAGLKPKTGVTPYDVERIATIRWDRVKGAKGYKVYMSTTGSGKGYKLVKTIKTNKSGSRKKVTLKYRGLKNAEVWVKIKAYKKSGKKTIYGKASSPLKITIMQAPTILSLKKGADGKVQIAWNSIYKAANYEVYITDSIAMYQWLNNYNNTHPNNLYTLGAPEAYLAVAKKYTTTATSFSFTPPESDVEYYVHIAAVRNNVRSDICGWEPAPR